MPTKKAARKSTDNKTVAKRFPRKASAKKTVARKATGKNGKATAKKETSYVGGIKPESKPEAPSKKELGEFRSRGIRKPQAAVLAVLAKSKEPLARKVISLRGKVDLAYLTSYIGSENPAKRHTNDRRVMPSLRTLGCVSAEKATEGRGTVYRITTAGKKALADYEKSAKSAK